MKLKSDSTEVPKEPNHLEIEYISECKNYICQALRNILKDPDLCFCEFDPYDLPGQDISKSEGHFPIEVIPAGEGHVTFSGCVL